MRIDLVSCFDGGGKHVVSLLGRFLREHLQKMNVQCDYVKWDELITDDWSKYQHLFSLDKMGFTQRKLRKQLAGKLCTIEHIVYKRSKFIEDKIFVTIPANETATVSYMGWAADPRYCYPEKKEFVFIDHPYYNAKWKRQDYSHIFRNNCYDCKIGAVFLDNKGILKVQHNHYTESVFDRTKNISWEEILRYYRKASVFVVTHEERLGWSVIEAAMCGAVILMPKNAVNAKLINDIPHVIVDNMDDGTEVKERIQEAVALSNEISKCGYKKRVHLAEKYTWEKACKRIVEVLSG